MSYMGKGVTKAATMCLRHLAYEMSTTAENKVCLKTGFKFKLKSRKKERKKKNMCEGT